MKPCINKIKYDLEVLGFSVLEPFHDTLQIAQTLSRRFDSQFFESQGQAYKVNIFRQADLSQPENQDISKFDEFCKDIIHELTTDRLHLDAVFQTLDLPISKHIAQDPHFDRIPTLKFMLYVNDLSKENGAFCLSPGSHHWVLKKLGKSRQPHGAKGFLELTRDIPTYINDRIIPVEGKSGTLIIFNTDCIHHQGIVKTKNCKIIRAHYRIQDRLKSLIGRIKLMSQ